MYRAGRFAVGRPWRRAQLSILGFAVALFLAVLALRLCGIPPDPSLAPFVLVSLVVSLPVGVMGVREGERVRAQKLAAAASPPALDPIALAAPDSGPGQCRVCGMEDLGDWADGYVVAYGTGRAHRDCGAVRPYVAPQVAAGHECDGRSPAFGCARCTDAAHQWKRDREIQAAAREQREREELLARFQALQRDQHSLMVLPPDCTVTPLRPAQLLVDVPKGSYWLWLDRDPGRGSFRLGDPVDSGRFEVITVLTTVHQFGSPRVGVHATEPLRHDYRGRSGVVLAPMSNESLFNHDAGRPFTHVELSMACVCDRCVGVVESGPPLVRHTLRASVRDTEQLVAEVGRGVISAADARARLSFDVWNQG